MTPLGLICKSTHYKRLLQSSPLRLLPSPKRLKMDIRIESGWKAQLSCEFEKEYFLQLSKFVRQEYETYHCFPPPADIFAAFNRCPFDQTRVVIIGQDPYIRPDQAHGLSFSVRDGVVFPPSLRNILKEVAEDTGTELPLSGDLSRWAEQGVLLLNATLTVREGASGSHQGKGWETFTDAAIRAINAKEEPVAFLLWGSFAQKKASFVDTARHLVLKAPHPSPLSAHRGFFGSRHFSMTNHWLSKQGLTPVVW